MASRARGGGPFVVAGFSFGSLCALRAAPRLRADVLFLIGLPADRWSGEAPPAPAPRVVWIQGGNDEFSPAEKARALADERGWTFRTVPGADHFFSGRLDAFEAAAGELLAEALGSAGT